MSSIASIAASGMAAASARLTVSARNVAASAGIAPPPAGRIEIADGAFARLSPPRPGLPTYDPGALYADQNGMVVGPDADLAEQLVAQITARFAFSANAAVLRAYRQMSDRLLDVMA